jgi:DNA-binding protein YbaB
MTTPLPSLPSLISPLNTLVRAISDFEASLATISVTQASTDGKVTVVANGEGRVVSITIDQSLIASGDNVAVANSVKTVANAALANAIQQSAARAVTFANGLALPGLPAFNAPQPDFAGFGSAVSLVSQTALLHNPCKQPRTFSCDSGPVHATVTADRRILTLVFDAPLSEDVTFLQASAVDAINCANGKSTIPPDDPHGGVGGIVEGSLAFENIVLYANGSVNIGPSVLLRGIGCQGFAPLANAGTQGTVLGPSSEYGIIVSRAAVVIGPQTLVHGSLRTEQALVADPTVVIDGPVTQNGSVSLPDLQIAGNFPATAQSPVVLAAGAHRTVQPAYYSSIQLGSNSQLTVTAGVYFTDSLDVEPGAVIIVNASAGPVVLWIKKTLIFKGALRDAANVFPRIWVGYLGSDPVSLTTPFQGSIVAPKATLTLPTVDTPRHIGSFHALNLQVGPGQTICHRPFEIPFASIPGRA